MCGIVGFAGFDPRETASLEVLQGMVRAIAHRGPDDQGYFLSGPAGLGMCRLSIIDLSGGHQPIANEDGSLTLVCNGEIYNHRSLRPNLIRRGHRFRTESDVEVILHLYEEHGADCVKYLQGMFAFALWDAKERKFFAARDRLGIKPLFITETDGFLFVASEIKALLHAGKARRELSPAGFEDFLTFGYIPAPYTIFNNIRKVEPGHYITLENGHFEDCTYWNLQVKSAPTFSEDEWEERLLTLLRQTVKSHMMSDVPLGAFLSGGVDSSLIVALMSEVADCPVNTFTLGFGGQKGGYLDERGLARLVSRRYGTLHTEFEVEPHFADILDTIVNSFDEPFADDSVIPTTYICKLTAQKVKVALTGLGGDELFGGYERYLGLRLSQIYCALPGSLRRYLIRPMVDRIPEMTNGHYTINHLKRFVRSGDKAAVERYRDYVSVFGAKDQETLLSPAVPRAVKSRDAMAHFNALLAPTLLDRALYQDLHTYLPEDLLALSDRLSMHYGLELRVPFVDHEMVEFCAGIPACLKIKYFQKKYLLKKLARRFVPKEILAHRKQGFAAPLASWLRGDLRDYFSDALAPSRLSRHGLFNATYVQKLLDDHWNRNELNDKKIFAIFMFQKWYENYME